MGNTTNFSGGFVSNSLISGVDLGFITLGLSGNDVCLEMSDNACKRVDVSDRCVDDQALIIGFQARSNVEKASSERILEIVKVLSFCSLVPKTRKEILGIFDSLDVAAFEDVSEYEIACKLRDLNRTQFLVDLGYLIAFDVPFFENQFGAKIPMRNRQSFVLSVSGVHLLSFLNSKGYFADNESR